VLKKELINCFKPNRLINYTFITGSVSYEADGGHMYGPRRANKAEGSASYETTDMYGNRMEGMS